ncbi:MAG: FadR family transcriptional regulator [Planctomycetaceae bacterium]|nr:FadR family transcriptional regulator [Planctomycetaceae bacterium]
MLAPLQRKILEGELAPGDRLPSEREMMDTFGVSRPTVREALRVAESLGLVAVRHGDPGGPRVLGQPSAGVAPVLINSDPASEKSLFREMLIRSS